MSASNEVRTEIKAILLQIFAEIETQLAGLLNGSSQPVRLDTPIEPGSRVDAMQHHQMALEMALATLDREKQRLELVRNALERIGRPDFGDCVSCGKLIALVRLRKSPDATRCRPCVRKADRSSVSAASLRGA